MQPLKTIGDRIRTRRCLLIKPFTHCTSDMETVKEMKTACSWPPPCRACEVYSCSLESGAPLHPPTLRPSQAFLLLTGLVAACFLPVLAHAPFRSRGGLRVLSGHTCFCLDWLRGPPRRGCLWKGLGESGGHHRTLGEPHSGRAEHWPESSSCSWSWRGARGTPDGAAHCGQARAGTDAPCSPRSTPAIT